MIVTPLALQGVFRLELQLHGDNRGFFARSLYSGPPNTTSNETGSVLSLMVRSPTSFHLLPMMRLNDVLLKVMAGYFAASK